MPFREIRRRSVGQRSSADPEHCKARGERRQQRGHLDNRDEKPVQDADGNRNQEANEKGYGRGIARVIRMMAIAVEAAKEATWDKSSPGRSQRPPCPGQGFQNRDVARKSKHVPSVRKPLSDTEKTTARIRHMTQNGYRLGRLARLRSSLAAHLSSKGRVSQFCVKRTVVHPKVSFCIQMAANLDLGRGNGRFGFTWIVGRSSPSARAVDRRGRQPPTRS